MYEKAPPLSFISFHTVPVCTATGNYILSYSPQFWSFILFIPVWWYVAIVIRPSWSFISLRTGFKFNIQNAEMLKTLKYIGVKKCYIYNIDGQNL